MDTIRWRFSVFTLLFCAAAHGQSQIAQELGELYAAGNADSVVALGLPRLQADTGDVDLNLLVGRALVDLGRHAEAEALLARVVRFDRKISWRSAWALSYLGECAYAAGHVQEAADRWNACLEMHATANVDRRTHGLMRAVGLDPHFRDWNITETAHIRVHFPPGASAAERERAAQTFESSFASIDSFFHATLPRKIDVFLWTHPEDAQRLGIWPLAFARPELLIVHTEPHHTRGHELAHVISHWAVKQVASSRFINEGIGMCFNLTGEDPMLRAREALRSAGVVDTIPVRLFWNEGSVVDDRILYAVGGAFVRHLIDAGGAQRFLQVLADQRYAHAREIYGAEFDHLVRSFEDSLYAR